MTIGEQIEEIIDRYYIENEDRYSSWREHNDEVYEIDKELKEFLISNDIKYGINRESGFENAGINTASIAVAFIDEDNDLNLITVCLEDY